METDQAVRQPRVPWNKGKRVGQKAPFKPKDVWAMRARMQQEYRTRDLALLNLGIESQAARMRSGRAEGARHPARWPDCAVDHRRATQDRSTSAVRNHACNAGSGRELVREARLTADDPLFPSHIHHSPHICTLQYARMLRGWVREIGLDWTDYGTHSMRRTKAALIYQKTKNPRAVQLLLGHSKLESTVRYLGVDVHDALDVSEQTEI